MACSLPMFFERALRRTAATIPIILGEGGQVELPVPPVPAAVKTDNSTGARDFMLSSTGSHRISFRLRIDDDRKIDDEGTTLHITSHSCFTVFSNSLRVASRRVGVLKRVRAVYNGLLYLVVWTTGLYGERTRYLRTIFLSCAESMEKIK